MTDDSDERRIQLAIQARMLACSFHGYGTSDEAERAAAVVDAIGSMFVDDKPLNAHKRKLLRNLELVLFPVTKDAAYVRALGAVEVAMRETWPPKALGDELQKVFSRVTDTKKQAAKFEAFEQLDAEVREVLAKPLTRTTVLDYLCRLVEFDGFPALGSKSTGSPSRKRIEASEKRYNSRAK